MGGLKKNRCIAKKAKAKRLGFSVYGKMGSGLYGLGVLKKEGRVRGYIPSPSGWVDGQC